MFLKDFKSLNEDDRYITWLANAIEIARYEKCGVVHVLYQLDNFYVEMNLVKGSPEKVKFTAFVDDYRLLPFLEKIDITEINTWR